MSATADFLRVHGLDAALRPESVAIIGASDNPHKIGGRPLMYLSRFGFRGRVYPVNLTRDSVQGIPAYRDVADLPEAPDLAIVAVSAERTPEAVRACADRGVKAAILMASGFGEATDPAGQAAEARILATARAAGMRLVGPNSQGLANFQSGAVSSFSTMFVEVAPADGPVAILSQSGVMSVVPYGQLRERGIGVRHAHATGNEVDVTLSELALAVVHDPDIRLLLLYLESIRDPGVLARAAAVARDRDIPIVAVKAGRSSRGAQAARSHTAALISDDQVVEAFLREHGIWRADDMHGLVRATELYLKEWRPRGRELVVVSSSGASGVMAADSAAAHGLPLSTFSDSMQHALAAELPAFASVTNPIDITAAILSDRGLFGKLLPLLARQHSTDLFLLAFPVLGEGYDVGRLAATAAAFAVETGKPVLVAAPQERAAAQFREAGTPTFANQTDAIAALAQLASHTELLRRPRRPSWPPLDVVLPPRCVAGRSQAHGGSSCLNEDQSLAFLAANGLPVVPHAVCRSEADAVRAFRAFGGAVVVKACSADVPHKSDHGLVVLGVTSADGAARAYRTVSTRLAALGACDDGVLVAPMISACLEVALGARVDPTFGLVVMVGGGGRHVEVLRDVAVLLPPFDELNAQAAWRSLRVAPRFAGGRGEPALDLDALCAATVRFGQVVAACAGRLTSVDVNPVMVSAAGAGVVMVDALVELAEGH